MTAREHTTKVWQEAARELGFTFVPGFTLHDGTDTFTYLGLVEGFGSSRGMLVITEQDYDPHVRAAEKQGYGYSCMSEHTEPYDRQTFVEVLNDWGWTGSQEHQPPWYTGEPWTS